MNLYSICEKGSRQHEKRFDEVVELKLTKFQTPFEKNTPAAKEDGFERLK